MSALERRWPRPLAITMGDPAGIGPEITVKAWRDCSDLGLPPFAVFADPDVLLSAASAAGIPIEIQITDNVGAAARTFADALPVVPVRCAAEVKPGFGDKRNAAAVIASIEAATRAVVEGDACALVTNPIAKHVLHDAGFAHPGHTEFLGVLAERRFPGRNWRPVMMLASDELRVVPVTIHVPLAEVPRLVTIDLIVETVTILAAALRSDFGVARPRIAVAGLNPHAGEAGAIGREEIETIAPAVAALIARGLSVSGPHSADTLFHAAARTTYDAVVAMYHDQALIPLKTLAFDRGVNITLGLPFVRTSPDHGTAFNIAGRNRASPASLIASLELAARMAARRGFVSS